MAYRRKSIRRRKSTRRRKSSRKRGTTIRVSRGGIRL